ncbi:OPT superfamily oligopeptide transporter [Athelia psychrophila]|nr:OPT superfamily oligopeptide transporter [Fibularhizoctonia sp. CBS 109695]
MNWRSLSSWQRPADTDSEAYSAAPEFTLKAVLLGLLIGCLLCFTNLYFGLQTGWISMMSLQSALIGFLLSRLLPIPLSAKELVVCQTTAVATGTMPLAAGFVGILPALGLLSEEQDGTPPVVLSWMGAIGWSCSVAFFGVFLSPPIRKQVIIKEQLAFPSGMATAQLISVLHHLPPPETSIRRRTGYEAVDSEAIDEPQGIIPDVVEDFATDEREAIDREGVKQQGWSDLLWSFLASGVMTLSAYFFPVVFSIPLFGSYMATEWLWSFTPSLSYVGQGIIMGFPTTLSMNLGMLVGWGILSPIATQAGWATGPVGDMASGARGWILWVSLSIMCADSVVSLLPVIAEIAQKFLPGRIALAAETQDDGECETEDRLVPLAWVLWGLGGSVVVGTALVRVVFGQEGIKPWATLVGFVVGGLLSVLGVRALGETDLNPVSGLGKISQLLFAWIQPGNVVANIIAGGVAEAGAQQAGDLMQDLKTGHLIHASPRAQFFGQLIGSSVSIVVTSTAYSLYQRAYTIPGPAFPAPTAYVWLSLARLLRDGQLPEHCGIFMLAFALLFAGIAALKIHAARRQWPHAKWIPSGVAFAIGFLNTPSFSLARLVGGIVEHVYRTRVSKGNRGDIRIIVIASGFVLGEGVVSIVSLILKTVGVGVISCVGCSPGLCGGCPA